jgi:hypothetical protein
MGGLAAERVVGEKDDSVRLSARPPVRLSTAASTTTATTPGSALQPITLRTSAPC